MLAEIGLPTFNIHAESIGKLMDTKSTSRPPRCFDGLTHSHRVRLTWVARRSGCGLINSMDMSITLYLKGFYLRSFRKLLWNVRVEDIAPTMKPYDQSNTWRPCWAPVNFQTHLAPGETALAAQNRSDSPDHANREDSKSSPGVAFADPGTQGSESQKRLDDLIDLVGELVIASASASLLAHRNGQPDLAEANSTVSLLVERIRDATLQMRMVKIGATFDRIQQASRDIVREPGKEVELVFFGSDTELDKSVVERIADPLMQLVRYAFDNALESSEDRLAAGKPAIGCIELRAFHDSASIVIEVVDDGLGLDRAAILADAVANGLYSNDSIPSDDELANLVVTSGFSGHAGKLEAVGRSIAALRGSINVSDGPNGGARFAIRLPLTLAIIDGFLTGVGNSSYVIPLDSVVECLELTKSNADREYLNLRGEVLPFVRLRELFAIPGPNPDRENVVVVQYAGQRTGIVVDQLMGEFQTVIKPLGTLFSQIRGIGGSTILGSGEVALILDVQALVNQFARGEEQPGECGTHSHRHELHAA